VCVGVDVGVGVGGAKIQAESTFASLFPETVSLAHSWHFESIPTKSKLLTHGPGAKHPQGCFWVWAVYYTLPYKRGLLFVRICIHWHADGFECAGTRTPGPLPKEPRYRP